MVLFNLLLFFSCTNFAQQAGSLSPEEFEKGILEPGIQLLDVRTAGEYNNGHIKGCLQADWNNRQQFDNRTTHLDKQKPLYLYCQSGVRSAAAADYLRKKGFTKVYDLKGGLIAWNKSGRRLSSTQAAKEQTPADVFDQAVREVPLVLVDFGAEWCPPCKKMEPVLAAFMQEQGDKVKLLKMDGGNETRLMEKLNVEALPTFILYKDGRETVRKQGILSKEELSAWINGR